MVAQFLPARGWWRLDSAGGPDRLLARAAGRVGTDADLADLGWPEPLPSAAAISIPRPPGPATGPAADY
jgi:hypothetical protein